MFLAGVIIWIPIFFSKPFLKLTKRIFRDIYTQKELKELKKQEKNKDIT
jgi:hypothetical protein